MKARLRTAIAGIALGLALLGGSAASALEAVSREYEIKAAFLFNFTKFVEWPPGHFESEDTPIVIGLLGHDPFQGVLEAIVEERSVQGRGLVVRQLESAAHGSGVDVVFVPAGGEALADPRTLEALHRAGILTVGESRQFAANGGIVTFLKQGGKVRFAINRESAERNALRLSSQLLQLAVARGAKD